jgi:hypothetical protein
MHSETNFFGSTRKKSVGQMASSRAQLLAAICVTGSSHFSAMYFHILSNDIFP